MSELIPIETPLRKFKGHEKNVDALAVFPDKRRMITSSWDETLCLWDLKTGVVLKKMKGHSNWVQALAVSRDGQLIASGDINGEIIVWHGETGESLTEPIKAQSYCITSLDFSPDGTVLATGSHVGMTQLWNTKTWEQQGNPIKCGGHYVRYSPSGELLAIATFDNIEIYNTGTREPVASFKGHNLSLGWTPDGTRLLTGGNRADPSIREWDTTTWQQVGDPWTGHTSYIHAIAVNPAGTFVASASDDRHVRLWRLSDRRTVAIFKHSSWTQCVTFSVDGAHILSGGGDDTISEWTVPQEIDPKILAITTARVACIDGDLLDSASDVAFVNRSKAKLDKMLWEDALLDAQKVTELNPSSHIGYQLMYAALRGAQRYDEAIVAFKIMLSKLDNAPEAQIRDLRKQYVSPSEVEDAIQSAIWIQLEYAPLRLLNTSTGLLCDEAAQINDFKTSADYKELLSSITKLSDLQMERIKDVVGTYFRYVLLSHRWEAREALLHDIQDKVVYELNGLGSIVKLQSFCKIARDAGYRWAWMDTCCIDKMSNVELQESINSMFLWYHHSALTIVYLSDVPPSSQPGSLARSVWNARGWTFQEFVAPKVVIFYQKDWSLYLGDRSPNHKESPAIMKELEDATGIDARALISFRPGMSNVRQKLQWASSRVTTKQEDIAYSLFGVFDVHLPVIYGENVQRALGRLLQEIVARSGDVTVLDWIGQPSDFNSCLPAYITSYTTPPRTISCLSEDQIQITISWLGQIVPTDLALKIYDQLDQLRAPRFANSRLHLPCIVFRVTEVRLTRSLVKETPITYTYRIKADGLHDLLITTEERLARFSPARPSVRTLKIVCPWCRYLLGVPDVAKQPDFADDTESIGNLSEVESTTDDPQMDDSNESPGGSPVEEEPGSRALRLMVRLMQPFDAFLLAQQRSGEYRRIASDHNIVAQVKDIASVDNIDVRTVEII